MIDIDSLLEVLKEHAKMKAALGTIANWDLPKAELRDGTKCSYGCVYGSNGERDYMRNIAIIALEPEKS